jgi:hypothetical protein
LLHQRRILLDVLVLDDIVVISLRSLQPFCSSLRSLVACLLSTTASAKPIIGLTLPLSKLTVVLAFPQLIVIKPFVRQRRWIQGIAIVV